MALHPCPRCKRLIQVGVSYCPECAPIAEAQAAEAIERKTEYRRKKYNTAYNKRRDPKYLTFYRSKNWKAMSKAKLQDCGYKCELRLEGCTRLATEVDHTVPIQTPEGWERRLDWSNLKGTCTSCHNRKHARFKKRGDAGVIDLRTVPR